MGHSATVCDVTTEQLSNGTTQISQKFTFHENISFPLHLLLTVGMLGLRLTVHAFMIELDPLDYLYPRNMKNYEIYVESQWRVVLL